MIGEKYIDAAAEPEAGLAFLQENFFQVLFHSLFKTLGCSERRLELYSLVNLCVRGVVLSGDNLFDGEDKLGLPLRLGRGRRFRSIMQLMCFQRLIELALAERGSWLEEEERRRLQRDLLTELAAIGALEGSEEEGVRGVPRVETMIRSVHAVRGGSLFSLAFVAPRVGERGRSRPAWARAEAGIRRLGTAFQIVDDLTDLEFDIGRRSHNLVVAQVRHHGSPRERAVLERLFRSPELRAEGGWVEGDLRESAGRVLNFAKVEAQEAFQILRGLGFWFPPDDALLFVRAVAGDAGFERLREIPVMEESASPDEKVPQPCE